MTILQSYIDKYQNNSYIWDTLKSIVEKNNEFYKSEGSLEKIINTDDLSEILKKRYAELYEKYNSEYGESEFKSLNLKRVKTFEEMIRKWKPNERDSFGFVVTGDSRFYPIIIGFLLKLDASDVNTFISELGFQKLNGRNLEECAYIYSLNNEIEYDSCILEIYDKIIMETYKSQKNINEKTKIDSWEKLEKYVQTNSSKQSIEQDESCNDGLEQKVDTLELTEKIFDLGTIEDLKSHINLHYQDFLDFRETPRILICKAILDYTTNEDSSPENFSEDIQSLWWSFCEYFGYYTNIRILDNMSFAYTPNKKIKTSDYIDYSKSLIAYIEGTKQVKRIFFVLFMIFLQKHETIDNLCEKCGFKTIDDDKQTLFEMVVSQIKNQPCISPVIPIENIINEIFVVNAYFVINSYKFNNEHYSNENNLIYISILESIKKVFSEKESVKNKKDREEVELAFELFSILKKIMELDFEGDEEDIKKVEFYKKNLKDCFCKDNFIDLELAKSIYRLARDYNKLKLTNKDSNKHSNMNYYRFIENPVYISKNDR